MLIEAGRLGVASEAGWYRYGDGGDNPAEDRALLPFLDESAMAQRVRRRVVGDEEILARCLAAAVHGSARLIEDGVAREAADLDRLWNRLGFPRWKGGLLYAFGASRLPERVADWLACPPQRDTLGPPSVLLRSWLDGVVP
jgi:3-hydroxyacyl-CoA dehydrogenase